MPRPKHHETSGRPCAGVIRAIYTRQSDTGKMSWVSLGWLCDKCHKWAEYESELT